MGSHHAERRIAHVGELVVVGDVAGGDQADARLVEAALGEFLHEGRALAGRQEDEQGFGRVVLHPLQERREVGGLERRADLLDDLAAALLEHVAEPFLGVVAGAVVGDQRHDLVDVVLQTPLRHRRRRLRQRERSAHDVGRLLGDHRRRRGGDDLRHFRFGRDRRDGERQRGEAEAHQRLGVVVGDEVLGEALGHVGRAGIVLDLEDDLLAGDRVAMELDVEIGARLLLLAGGRLLAGHRHDQADGHDVVGERRPGDERRGGGKDGNAAIGRHQSSSRCYSTAGRAIALAPFERRAPDPALPRL